MLIRTEIGVDAAGIDSLLRRCFQTGDGANLVRELREEGQLTLGMVATDDNGHIWGYAAFSPVLLDGEDRGWVTLAPLAVDKSRRRQGTGGKLIYEGLDTLNEFGYAAVVVLGEPAFYQRYGFEPAARHQLCCPWPDAGDAFQVYKLADNAFSDSCGKMEWLPYFNHFTD